MLQPRQGPEQGLQQGHWEVRQQQGRVLLCAGHSTPHQQLGVTCRPAPCVTKRETY